MNDTDDGTVSGYGDLAFDLKIYIMCSISIVFQSLYMVLVQRNSYHMTVMEILHLNSYNTLPPLLVAAIWLREFQNAADHFIYDDPLFILLVSLVVCLGCVLNYLLFLCTSYNSALTTSITGTMKNIIQTSLGLVTFGGVSRNIYTILGIAINMFGGLLYSYAKWTERKKELGNLKKVSSKNEIENKSFLKISSTDESHAINGGYDTTLHHLKEKVWQRW